MRTTVDLPPELHRRVQAIARDRRQSLSRTLAQLVEASVAPTTAPAPSFRIDPGTGLPVVSLGRTITSEDVRSLDDR